MNVTLHDVLQTAVPPAVYRTRTRQRPSTIRERVETNGWRYSHLNGQRITNKASFLHAIGEAMVFPTYFGHNWDALADALSDIAWQDAQGWVVLYDHVAAFAEGSANDWAVAQELLQEAAQRWQEQGKMLYVLLRG